MHISKRRRSRVEPRATVSTIRRRQRRPINEAMLRVRPFRVNAAELARRKFLHLAAGAAVLPTASGISWAQAYPSRPVRLVVGFPAGGANDIYAMTLSVAGVGPNSGVSVAEVNLLLVWNVVSQMKVGERGQAYEAAHINCED